MPRRFFAFEWPKGNLLAPRSPLLLTNRPAGKYPTIAFDNLTQHRRFFDPRVIYQDADALLVAVAPTAKPNSLHQIQCLGVATGRVLWSRPASPFDFQNAVHPPDGFALGYRSGPELDYVHGWPTTAANWVTFSASVWNSISTVLQWLNPEFVGEGRDAIRCV